MAEVINFIISGIMDAFDKMMDIEFLGTNMLAFALTITILGILIPIIFTVPGKTVGRSIRSDRKPR